MTIFRYTTEQMQQMESQTDWDRVLNPSVVVDNGFGRRRYTLLGVFEPCHDVGTETEEDWYGDMIAAE